MSVEPELKFRVVKRNFGALTRLRIAGAETGEVTRRYFVSTYYDTPKQKLHRYRLTLRVRKSGEQYRQTIKAMSATSFARGEWETDVRDARPNFDKIDETPLGGLRPKKFAAG